MTATGITTPTPSSGLAIDAPLASPEEASAAPPCRWGQPMSDSTNEPH